MRWILKLTFVAMWALGGRAAFADTLIWTQAETAQLDAREWERTAPNERTFDAVHRAVLLRFPGAAEAIKARIDAGKIIERAEIQLNYTSYEVRPQNYVLRDGLGAAAWRNDPPRWHVFANAVRGPWVAHPTFGPTGRYRVRLLQPWASVNAGDRDQDRYPHNYGPAELSQANPLARLDVTELLTSPRIGADTGTRLRVFEENGLVLRKVEAYDMRYRRGELYEWAIPTGGHGLTFEKPTLEITFRPVGGPRLAVSLPPPANVVAESERASQTALRRFPDMRPLSELQADARQLLATRPPWMSDRQFANLADLFRAGGDTHARWLTGLAEGDPGRYRTFLRNTFNTPPRFWKGWGIADDLLAVNQLEGFIPRHIWEHLEAYWHSYLMPDLPTSAFFVPHSREANEYWGWTNDWRGRTSFFRAGYNFQGSTQNFNFTAVMGALLGGALIGSDVAMAEGRHGLEALLLRHWTLRDGSTQEMLDPYYLSITLSAVKMIADYGPTGFDRLVARIILERTMEMLASVYHPRLRRMPAAAGRARLSGFLMEQDGVYGALHVLSERGTLLYPDRPGDFRVAGLPVWGYDFPPGRVALQSLASPWAPAWFGRIIDDKPLPFTDLSTETSRGNFIPPLRRTTFLGAFFGLASQDIKGGMADILGQWARSEEAATRAEDVGTFFARACMNLCDLVTSPGGVPIKAGSLFTIQDRQRAIIFARPPAFATSLPQGQIGRGEIETFGAVLGFFMLERQPSWRLHHNGRLVALEALPISIAPGDRLIIEDGPSYIAVRPIPPFVPGEATAPKIIVSRGGFGGMPEAGRSRLEPALAIANLLKADGPAITRADYDAGSIGSQAFGGFVVEMGDRTGFADVAAFDRHINGGSVTVERMASDRIRVIHRSGSDVLEADFGLDVQEMNVHFPITPGSQTRAIARRLLNGASPLPPSGLDRETSWSQQGTLGRLEKNGAVLETERGRLAYLIADPFRRGVLAYNAQPDTSTFRLILDTGQEVRADGRIGLLRVAIDRDRRTLEIDHERAPSQAGIPLANRMTVKGIGTDWAIRTSAGLTIDRE